MKWCMDTYMHKTMVSIASLEKIEIIRSREFMPSEARLKFLIKMIMIKLEEQGGERGTLNGDRGAEITPREDPSKHSEMLIKWYSANS